MIPGPLRQVNLTVDNSGPMYRSAIYCDDETDLELAKQSAETYQKNLNDRGVTGYCF